MQPGVIHSLGETSRTLNHIIDNNQSRLEKSPIEDRRKVISVQEQHGMVRLYLVANRCVR